MKLVLTCLVICLLVMYSCTDDDDDCLCTMEFRMITVVVVDEMNIPVLDLTTTVKDDSGKVYDFYNDPLIFPGHYIVMDDNYAVELTIQPKRFHFTGVKDSLTINGEYFINTDECNCHVKKVSGPDTLLLK